MMDLKPNTNGIILNGEAHILVKTQDEEVCGNCSIRNFCADSPYMPCIVISDTDDEHFNKLEI